MKQISIPEYFEKITGENDDFLLVNPSSNLLLGVTISWFISVRYSLSRISIKPLKFMPNSFACFITSAFNRSVNFCCDIGRMTYVQKVFGDFGFGKGMGEEITGLVCSPSMVRRTEMYVNPSGLVEQADIMTTDLDYNLPLLFFIFIPMFELRIMNFFIFHYVFTKYLMISFFHYVKFYYSFKFILLFVKIDEFK